MKVNKLSTKVTYFLLGAFLVFSVMALQMLSSADINGVPFGHEISEVDGLQDELDSLNTRIAALENIQISTTNCVTYTQAQLGSTNDNSKTISKSIDVPTFCKTSGCQIQMISKDANGNTYTKVKNYYGQATTDLWSFGTSGKDKKNGDTIYTVIINQNYQYVYDDAKDCETSSTQFCFKDTGKKTYTSEIKICAISE